MAAKKKALEGPVVNVPPAPFTAWRTDPFERDTDAAHMFGYYLITKCRDEALKNVASAPKKQRAAIEEAVDHALHNVMDLFEGYWVLQTGEEHRIELALQVRVQDKNFEIVETRELAPCKMDLPIGYWIWAREREFQPPSVGEAMRVEAAAKKPAAKKHAAKKHAPKKPAAKKQRR